MRKGLVLVTVLLAGIVTTAGSAPAQKKITVPAGTRILIRTVDAIDSSKQKTGFRFTATLEARPHAPGVRRQLRRREHDEESGWRSRLGCTHWRYRRRRKGRRHWRGCRRSRWNCRRRFQKRTAATDSERNVARVPTSTASVTPGGGVGTLKAF